MLAKKLPITMPGASPLTSSQRTAPFLWCARTLETEVKMMVAMDVAMAILTAKSALTPWSPNMRVRKGTMTMPPPMPRSPAKKPVSRPNAASSAMRVGSKNIRSGFEEKLNKVSASATGPAS